MPDTGEKDERRGLADVTRQLRELLGMTVGELREKHLELFGEPTRSRNKRHLQKRLAWRVQELAEGGLSDRAKARIEELAKDAPLPGTEHRARKRAAKALDAAGGAAETKPRDPRLPPVGTVITRVHKGEEHATTVLDDGFEYRGERYASLSNVAKVITGTSWNLWCDPSYGELTAQRLVLPRVERRSLLITSRGSLRPQPHEAAEWRRG